MDSAAADEGVALEMGAAEEVDGSGRAPDPVAMGGRIDVLASAPTELLEAVSSALISPSFPFATSGAGTGAVEVEAVPVGSGGGSYQAQYEPMPREPMDWSRRPQSWGHCSRARRQL